MMKVVMLVIGEIVQVKLAGDASFPKDVGSGGALQPSHNGQVVALQAMGPLLISGAQDGTMRIWDMRSPSTKDRMLLPPRDGPRCLYGLGVCACMRERKRRRIVCAPPLRPQPPKSAEPPSDGSSAAGAAEGLQISGDKGDREGGGRGHVGST
jgi:hypothetical protein